MTPPLPDSICVINDIEALAAWLLDELLRAGAVRLESGEIVLTMAA